MPTNERRLWEKSWVSVARLGSVLLPLYKADSSPPLPHATRRSTGLSRPRKADLPHGSRTIARHPDNDRDPLAHSRMLGYHARPRLQGYERRQHGFNIEPR